ncbi:DEAD/DEAH box helicase family protein [Myroides odoratimimus]|uniref:DEAD/DEAH box helicase family protein n=1 Tax=Myroides odoratimimus TaxID=76832 RepID=UPI00257665B9|nr:DEAD/DEAH box helicase family protein [Myroides odoratimimus]MDM1530753.1 DEAD/DEAH box helicase family protein [Myroides odoratimimus]
MNFKNIKFPETLKVSSNGEMIPFEFFGEIIPLSQKIQFKLGYFSSASISTLSYGFAQFIYNGGTVDFLINHFVTEGDFKLLNNEIIVDHHFYNSIEEQILSDLEKLNDVFTKKQVSHFYNCLRYLIDNNRIKILPVTTKNGEISHYKEALFWDYNDNVINIVGSCNFTYKGIVCNGESFVVNRSWGENSERANIANEQQEYEIIFSQKSKDFIYLEPEKLINIIKQKSTSLSCQELLLEELDLFEIDHNTQNLICNVNSRLEEKFKINVEELLNNPRFPKNQSPRDYQKEAYEKWKNNNFHGVFAMATGTGKTKTSLNCLVEEFKLNKSYFSIILVPSISLLDQWEEEIKEFNFKNILKVGGGSSWEQFLPNYTSNFKAGLKNNLIIISTYDSFCSDRFQKYFKNIESEFILIADEAHNIGANNIKAILENCLVNKKIGLSATPKRIYDLEGTQFIDKFFNDQEPYLFSFDMKQAMDRGYLAPYYYYPVIVQLKENEFKEYVEISKQLLKYFDFEHGMFKKDPVVERLLLKRKSIIHKAENKLKSFQDILLELKQKNKLQYIFTYVPEGFRYNENGIEQRIIDEYLLSANSVLPTLKMNTYTSESETPKDILRGFEEGKIDMLLAMKMLDEGVDIPRAEIGIFASSTGNPRQYIQRRGRLLRKHRDKEVAIIYDMIVIPSITQNSPELYSFEKNMVKNELRRVGYFASLAINFYDSKDVLEHIFIKYELDLDTIINEL